MVARWGIALALCVWGAAGLVQAQSASGVRAVVENTDVHVHSPFYLTIEYFGRGGEEPTLPRIEGLTIDTASRQVLRKSMLHSTSNGMQRSDVLQYRYVARATTMGEVIIPAIEAVFNGQVVRTEKIVLTVLEEDLAVKYPVHLWVSRTTLKKGQWFWIYIEAPQLDHSLPNQLSIEGLENAPFLPENETNPVYSARRPRSQTRGYRVRANEAGTIPIPSMPFKINRRTVYSNSLELRVLDTPSSATESIFKAPVPRKAGDDIRRSDSLFVTLDVDTREASLGEPIVLTTQLWQLQHSAVSVGSRRGALNTPPTTEGFYVHPLDSIQFLAYHGDLPYTVTEQRKILYPTKTGELSIGRWVYEGDIVSRRNISYYTVEHGPYSIKVKPFRASPAGFTGTVGQFEVGAKLDATAFKAGVPVHLTVSIRGEGNSGAIGAPVLPKLPWAHVSTPERAEKEYITFGQLLPGVKKTFSYTLTPTEVGQHTIPAFDYATFDPQTQEYRVKTLGPFQMKVQPGDDEQVTPLLSKEDTGMLQRAGLQEGEIHPLLPAPETLARTQSNTLRRCILALIPMLLFAGVSYRMRHRWAMLRDVGYARAHRAKEKSLERLREVLAASEPTEALFRTVIEYMGNTFNVAEDGMTSSDVESLLSKHQVDPSVRVTVTRLLKSCERALYAGHELSDDELRALVQAAEAAITVLDDREREGDAR